MEMRVDTNGRLSPGADSLTDRDRLALLFACAELRAAMSPTTRLMRGDPPVRPDVVPGTPDAYPDIRGAREQVANGQQPAGAGKPAVRDFSIQRTGKLVRESYERPVNLDASSIFKSRDVTPCEQ